MESVTELLDKTKEMCGIESDNQLAIRLKVTRTSVSTWRNGRGQPDAVSCAKIAEITGIPLARVLGIVGEARAISREEKAVWRRLASAAAILLMLLPALPSQASIRPDLTGAGYMHYAKWKAVARFLSAKVREASSAGRVLAGVIHLIVELATQVIRRPQPPLIEHAFPFRLRSATTADFLGLGVWRREGITRPRSTTATGREFRRVVLNLPSDTGIDAGIGESPHTVNLRTRRTGLSLIRDVAGSVTAFVNDPLPTLSR